MADIPQDLTPERSAAHRLEAITNLIFEVAAGNLTARCTPLDEDTDLDAVMVGLNMLIDELQHQEKVRNRMEDELRASEERYRGLFESAIDMVHILDGQCKAIDINETELFKLVGSIDQMLVQINMMSSSEVF